MFFIRTCFSFQLQPKKFRKNGGGVLIAHRRDIDVTSVKLSKVNIQAELLSVNIKTQCGRSFCISTFYRVGTLEAENHRVVDAYLRTLTKIRKFNKIVLIGDVNLNKVSWPDGITTCQVQSDFIDTFNDLNFTQLIDKPTHIEGNTLDLLFSDLPNIVDNVKVL